MFEFDDSAHESFRANTGFTYIYLLKKGGVNVYVGQTVELKNRVAWHRGGYTRKEFDSVSFSIVKLSDANNEEAKAIVKYNPLLNGNLPSNDEYISTSALAKEIQIYIKESLKGYKPPYTANRSDGKNVDYIKMSDFDLIKEFINKVLNK